MSKLQTVLITGASGGLGEAIAYSCAKRNYQVILAARNEKKLKEVSMKCGELNGLNNSYYIVDMSSYDSIESFYEQIAKYESNISCLVNCAGYGLFENFIDIDASKFEDMFRVNVLGLMYLTQKLAVDFIKQGYGHIINVASQAGKMATPKSTLYSATKFAVIGFSNALRLELKPANVYVTTVNPGPISTNFFNIADKSGNYLSAVDWLVLDPDVLAEKIVDSIGTNKRELNAPFFMEIGSKLYTLFPRIGDYCAGELFNKK